MWSSHGCCRKKLLLKALDVFFLGQIWCHVIITYQITDASDWLRLILFGYEFHRPVNPLSFDLGKVILAGTLDVAKEALSSSGSILAELISLKGVVLGCSGKMF